MASGINGNAKVTLHWLEKSRSQRILWLLEELEIPYELKTYKRGSDLLAEEALQKVHPLGKSPVITVEVPGKEEPIVIAESGTIVEYLVEHWGRHLIPKQYKDGQEGQVGGETEEWMRYKYYIHYAEGSLMALLVTALLIGKIKEAAAAPFFIKPICRAIGSKVEDAYLNRNISRHFDFLESQLASSPSGGEFFCGSQITGADFLMIFPLDAGQLRAGLTKEKYPHLVGYIEGIHKRDGWQRAVKKIESEFGKFELANSG